MKLFSKLRNDDERLSNIVSEFLDKNFYVKTINFKRIYSKKEQVEGIDVKFTLNNFYYLCDEKAAIRYINKPLNTFSMELSFIDKSNNIHDGWLLDENKVNNSFMFIWIDKATRNLLENVEDILKLELVIVKKDSIINYLNSLGWTYKKLIRKTSLMRDNKYEKTGNIKNDGCKFVISDFLVEKPVNVLISRDILRDISDFKQIITV